MRGYPTSSNFEAIWESTPVGHGTMRPTSALQILSEGSPTCPMYLRKALEHFIINGCLSLQYIISFAILIGYPTSGNFVQFERVEPSGKHHHETHKWQTDAARSSYCMHIHLLKALEHFISNGCVSLQYSTLFTILRGYPPFGILCAIWESPWWKMAHWDPQVPSRCYQSTCHPGP